MLEVKDLTKKYNSTYAVKGVSFTVPRGEVLVILGTSGCGKTTTLKMINRLIEKSSGDIFINGQNTDLLDAYELRRSIGYVIQETGLFPHYTIEKNIGVVPYLQGWGPDKVSARVDELIALIGLDSSFKKRMPHELSGGQRQRVGIARALAADPEMILLDEPFGALDPITREEMQKEFKSLEGVLDKVMVLVTHDVVEAVKLGHIICLMDNGEVQQIGSPKDLIFSPANDFVHAFFKSKHLELEPNIVTLADISKVLTPTEEIKDKPINPALTLAEVLAQYGDQPVYFSVEGHTYTLEGVLKTYYDNRQEIIDYFNNGN